MPMVSAKWNRQGGKRFGSPGRHDMRAVAMHAAVARWAPSSLIAYGISGPAAGVIAGQFCYAVVYRFGTACALLGGALVATARNPQSS